MDRTEVVSFIKSQLLSRTEYYELYGQVDDLSGGGRIDDVKVIEISYETRVNSETNFYGTILVEVVKEVGITRSSFTGTFAGYFDEHGLYLETASLDISTAGGEDPSGGKPNF
jgi:hypothetical protein